MKFKRRTIRSHIVIYFSIIIILTMSFLGIVVYQYFAKTMTQEIFQNSSQMVDQKRITVDSYFSQVETLLKIISSSDIIITPLQKAQNESYTHNLYDDRSITNYLMEIMKFNRDIKDFLIIGMDGQVLYYSGPNIRVDYNFYDQEWFPESLSQYSQVTFIGNHRQGYYYRGNQGEVVSAIIPIVDFMNPNRQVLGMVLCNLDTEKIKAINEGATDGNNEHLLVMDNNNQIINKNDNLEVSQHVKNKLIENFQINNNGHFILTDSLDKMIAVYSTSTITKWKIVALSPTNKLLKHLNNIRNFTFVVIVTSIIIMNIISLILSGKLTKPIFRLMRKMENIEKGEFNVKLYDNSYEEVEKLSSRIDLMVERINQLNKDIYSYELISKDANIKALQAQINPHFLFNTLQCIKSFAVCDRNKDINHIVTLIGNILRYSIYDTMDFVSLKNEIDHVKEYMQIQNYRYPDKFQLLVKYEKGLEEIMVLKLMLQPIIENSIKHGLHNLTAGIIRIDVRKESEEIWLTVTDDGKGINIEQLDYIMQNINDSNKNDDSHSIGLKNVHQRIKLKFGQDYGLCINSVSGKGCVTKVKIPYITYDEVNNNENVISG